LRTDFDIVGSFNAERVSGINAERTVNMFEFIDPKGKKPKALLPTSGLKKVLDLAEDGGFRATFVFKDIFYAIVKDKIYAIDEALVATLLGTITTTSGYAEIEANVHQLIFVDGVHGYIWDTTTAVFLQITAPGFPAKPIDVAFLDGFFVVAWGDTNQFNISDPGDGLVWQALNNAKITSHPGNITAIDTLHRRLFIFSDTYCEVWENAGLADFPFRRNNSLLMEYGTPAQGSVISGFNKLFFLSKDRDGLGSIVMVSGTQPIPISNQALDYQIQNYNNVSDARSLVYKENGIIFYRINFTSANKTWVFNATMSQLGDPKWHEEEMLNGARHVAQVHAFYNNKNYFGHYAKSILYEVDDIYLMNDTEAIRRLRITKPFIDPTYKKIRIDRVEMDLLQGDVPANGKDKEPTIYMAISKDGGQTYGNELSAYMGKIGDRTARTIWRKLGTTRDFIVRIQFFHNVRFVILGAAIVYEVLKQ
jgi:hypothetical protein